MPLDKYSRLKSDFVSGFIVFLIALPLCIGISVASGTPPTSGIIAAVIGGIFGSMITGSKMTINGPAAGLIVIVLAAVEQLGAGDVAKGYGAVLACTVIAGGMQIFLGVLRAGRLGHSFPGSVVHGMLSAIGIIIMSKQVHTMLGVNPGALSPLTAIAAIPSSIAKMNPVIAMIGIMSLGLMMVLTRTKINFLKILPPPLIATLTAVGLGLYMGLENVHVIHTFLGDASVGPNFLLNVPARIADAIRIPDFSMIGSGMLWKHATLICFVASIESILSACAVDRLDPEKRKSNLDRELIGKGICNMVSGAIGGLPMIAEIVRSSANISNGGKTQWSNFFHGLFLLLFLALVPSYLHLVPMTSLSAILVFVGYQLAKPSHFIHAFQKGRDSGLVFVVTVLAILATDLLLGVVIGGLLELVMVVWHSKSLSVFRLKAQHHLNDDHELIVVESPVTFSNYLSLKNLIDGERIRPKLTIDLRKSSIVDHTVMENLERHRCDFATLGRELSVKFSKEHRQMSAHPNSTRLYRTPLKQSNRGVDTLQ